MRPYVISLPKLVQQYIGHIPKMSIVAQVRIVIVVNEPVVMTHLGINEGLGTYERQRHQLMRVEGIDLAAAVNPIVFPTAAGLYLRNHVAIALTEIAVFRNLEILKPWNGSPNQQWALDTASHFR